MRIALIVAPLTGFALLAACGPSVHAPSLGLRAVEKQPIELPGPASEPQIPVDPALTARIAPLVESAQAGDRGFARQRIETESAFAKAKGAAPGSEAWIVAQQALSALDATRGPVRDAAGTIEAMRVEPANAGSGNRAAVESAATTIEALDDAETAVLAALSARLGG